MGNMKEIRPKIWYDYMKFLARKVGYDKKVHYNLIKKLHDTDFKWSMNVEMDENRANDGIYHRQYFFKDMGIVGEVGFPYPCSVLEMLVAFAIRMETDYLGFGIYEDTEFSIVFTMFLKNLEIYGCDDPIEIDSKLEFWMNREYQNDGFGSLFSLPRKVKGYNEMEIWKQMNVFLTENDVENLDDLMKFL